MNGTEHDYRLGDSVLVAMGDAPVPGVVVGMDAEQLQVRLAQPWSDESGAADNVTSVARDAVRPVLNDSATLTG